MSEPRRGDTVEERVDELLDDGYLPDDAHNTALEEWSEDLHPRDYGMEDRWR